MDLLRGPHARALNLQQTLILTTTLTFTGLAVAYAFRAGLFNIGGQGQYFAGLYIGVVVGSSLDGLPGWLHIILAVVLGRSPARSGAASQASSRRPPVPTR